MYHVDWVRAALSELAAIWTKADSVSRAAITTVAERIDRILELNPHDTGESRSAGRRILLEEPPGIYFRIEQDEKPSQFSKFGYFAYAASHSMAYDGLQSEYLHLTDGT